MTDERYEELCKIADELAEDARFDFHCALESKMNRMNLDEEERNCYVHS